MNISIIRTFIKLRSFLAMEGAIKDRVNSLEQSTIKLFKVPFEKSCAVEDAPTLKPSRKKIGLKLRNLSKRFESHLLECAI